MRLTLLINIHRFIGLGVHGKTDARVPTIIWYDGEGVAKAWGVNDPPDELSDEGDTDQSLRKAEWLRNILSSLYSEH